MEPNQPATDRNDAPPARLYKYRAFNLNTLRMLTEAEIYYASPRSFNDPLDCNPSIKADIELKLLDELCRQMLLRGYDQEFDQSTAAVKAANRIGHLRYMSDEAAHGERKTYYERLL